MNAFTSAPADVCYLLAFCVLVYGVCRLVFHDGRHAAPVRIIRARPPAGARGHRWAPLPFEPLPAPVAAAVAEWEARAAARPLAAAPLRTLRLERLLAGARMPVGTSPDWERRPALPGHVGAAAAAAQARDGAR